MVWIAEDIRPLLCSVDAPAGTRQRTTVVVVATDPGSDLRRDADEEGDLFLDELRAGAAGCSRDHGDRYRRGSTAACWIGRLERITPGRGKLEARSPSQEDARGEYNRNWMRSDFLVYLSLDGGPEARSYAKALVGFLDNPPADIEGIFVRTGEYPLPNRRVVRVFRRSRPLSPDEQDVLERLLGLPNSLKAFLR
jgi:hypothetical protein